MSVVLHPYPDEFAPALGVIIAKLRGDESIPVVEALHATWQIVGYALSHFDPHDTPRMTVADPRDLSDANLADELASRLSPQVDVRTVDIPWSLILSVAMEIIRRLLER